MAAQEARPRPATRAHPDPENEPQPQAGVAGGAPGASTARRGETAQQRTPQPRTSAQRLERLLLLRLTLLMTGLWILSVGTGACLNNGIPPNRAKLPLIWFDRLLRAYGPLLPMPVLLLRWYATLPPPGSGAVAGGPLIELLALYLAVSVARLGLYSAHLLLGPLIVALRGDGVAHLVSDHIVLGAALIAIFTAEAHLLAADVRRSWAGRANVDRAVLAVASAALAGLFALTCVEMHVTARHFHAPAESFAAIAFGLAFFQAPVSLFMLRVLG